MSRISLFILNVMALFLFISTPTVIVAADVPLAAKPLSVEDKIALAKPLVKQANHHVREEAIVLSGTVTTAVEHHDENHVSFNVRGQHYRPEMRGNDVNLGALYASSEHTVVINTKVMKNLEYINENGRISRRRIDISPAKGTPLGSFLGVGDNVTILGFKFDNYATGKSGIHKVHAIGGSIYLEKDGSKLS